MYVEGGIFWRKLVHECNKQGVEGGKKSKKSKNVEGGNVHGGWNFFSKELSVNSCLLEYMYSIKRTALIYIC